MAAGASVITVTRMLRGRWRWLCAAAALPLSAVAGAQRPAPLTFIARTIDTGLRGGYQAVITDLNRDGRPDLIAVATGLREVPWYENPGPGDRPWPKHLLMTGVNAPINAAAHDVDGDGIPEVALAADFSNVYGKSAGTLYLLTHKADPTEPWTAKEIDRTPTAHRVRWVDVDGRDKALVNAPLIGAGSLAPDYRDAVGIYYYRAPDWTRQTLTDADSGVIHGVWVTPWQGSQYEALLSASFNGVFVHRFQSGTWQRSRVVAGNPAVWPQSGASDVAVGRAGSARFLATIEPWHGNTVAVYHQSGATWTRQAIDESLVDGHTLVTADLDNDGTDEIIAGERGGKRSVYLYRAADASGRAWSRTLLDEGDMAGAGCAAADLNGDGAIDIACVGTATANLKVYWGSR